MILIEQKKKIYNKHNLIDNSSIDLNNVSISELSQSKIVHNLNYLLNHNFLRSIAHCNKRAIF